MKTCTKCKVEKELGEFSKNKRGKDGFYSQCKGCKNEYMISLRYDMSREEHSVLYESQQGRCAICIKPFEQYHQHTHVDHCHDSGKVRALLCSNCNTGLGLFGDIPEVLEKGAAYLRHHREKHQCEH